MEVGLKVMEEKQEGHSRTETGNVILRCVLKSGKKQNNRRRM